MIKKIVFLLPLLVIYSCSINLKKVSDDSNIQKALLNIKISDKEYLLSFLSKYPAVISYNPNRDANCIKIIKRNTNIIMIPLKYTDSPEMTEISIIKGLYIYNIMQKYNLNDYFYELEQLSEYSKMEYLLSYIPTEKINNDELLKKEILPKLCGYMTSPQEFDNIIDEETSRQDISCGYPVEKLEALKNYYAKLKASLSSIDSDEYFNLYYEKEMERVRRGEITREEAEKNYYYIFSEPQQNLYRIQRKETYENIYSLSKFESFYKKEIKRLRENRNKYNDFIRYFPDCAK
ncbi:MAG: hypothetical protein GX445_04720 [Elusimicrobia bacterium]|nr:hypothetical protein [Elusimicrobiota bacterium]